MGIFTKETVELVKLGFTTTPEFIPGERSECSVGSLQDVLTVFQEITTDLTNVFFVSSCPDNSLWIGDDTVIQRVKPEGSNLKEMSNFTTMIYDMAVTSSNDVLLITEGVSRLQQIKGSSGQFTDSVYSVDPLDPTAVHVTRDYKVIVGAHDSGRTVVIRMNKEGKHEKTHERDRNKQPIFTYVRSTTSTTNGTIFVVDRLSDDGRGRAVVLRQKGDALNTYTGHPKINSDDKPFQPMYAVTTPLDNIIVTDVDTYPHHILNSVGHLITYYNTKNIGILWPCSLSFTTSGQIYIGCSTAEGSTDKAKVYKVDISQI